MQPSRYNVVVAQGDEILAFNSLSGSIVRCCGDEAAEVEHLLGGRCSGACSSRLVDALVQQGFLIDNSRDEIAIVERRKRSGVEDRNRLDVIIMPTLACNFGCVYCYEERTGSVMSARVVDALRRWLDKTVPQHKLVMLHWFGGEPLIAFPTMHLLTRHARDVAARANVKCIVHVTTNGFLLAAKKIEDLIQLGVLSYQITLDGPPATHDQLRPLKNGQGSFDRCFANIVSLARSHPSVKVSLRINFNHTNIKQIPELLGLFPLDVRAKLRVVFEPIFGDDGVSAADNLTPDETSRMLEASYAMARTLGYDVVLGRSATKTGKLVYCYAERENQYIVNFNGDVFKCSVSKFHSEERVGFIRDDGVLVKDREKWRRWVGEPLFDQKCYDCAYLPLCMGGCRKARQKKEDTGSACALVPTNTCYALKQIAWGKMEDNLRDYVQAT